MTNEDEDSNTNIKLAVLGGALTILGIFGYIGLNIKIDESSNYLGRKIKESEAEVRLKVEQKGNEVLNRIDTVDVEDIYPLKSIESKIDMLQKQMVDWHVKPTYKLEMSVVTCKGEKKKFAFEGLRYDFAKEVYINIDSLDMNPEINITNKLELLKLANKISYKMNYEGEDWKNKFKDIADYLKFDSKYGMPLRMTLTKESRDE